MISFDEVVATNQYPNLELLDVSILDVKSISDMKLMSRQEVVDGDFIQVCDSLQWLASSRDQNGRLMYLSSDGSNVCIFTPTRINVNGFRLSPRGRLELSYINALEFLPPTNSLKETDSMNPQDNTSLDALINNVSTDLPAPSGASAGINPVTAFGGDAGAAPAPAGDTPPTKGSKNPAQEAALNTVRSYITENRTQVDDSNLRAVWGQVAEHLFWITSGDARDSVSVAKRKMPKSQRELLPNVGASIQELFKVKPNDVPDQYFKSVYEVRAQRTKPGPLKGAVVRIPAYLKGLSVADFTQNIAKDGPKDGAGGMSVVEMLTISDYEQKLILAGSQIREASLDGGPSPGTLRINVRPAVTRNKGVATTLGTATKLSTYFVRTSSNGESSRVVLNNSNYFPLTTYKTQDINTVMDEDTVKELNAAYFTTLFTGTKSTPGRYNLLSPELQGNILQDASGGITSKYITNGADKIALTVGEFYNADVRRPTLELPIKSRTKKEDGTMSAYRFVSYSVLADTSKLTDEERSVLAANTPLDNPRFAALKALAPDHITQAALSAMFKRSGGSGSARGAFFNESQSKDLLTALILGKGNARSIQISNFAFDY